MHINAYKCARMRQNTPGPHILTLEKPSGLKAKLTWTGMGWTGCGRAIRRANGAPMCHYMSSKSSYECIHECAYTSECICVH